MVWAIKFEVSDRNNPGFKLDPFDERPSPSRSYGFSKGFWVDPSLQPKSAQQTTKKLVHDVFPLPGLNAVRQRFKDLVEEFEPGVHQFFPIALRDKQGEPIDDKFYIFNCMVSMDAVLALETGLELKHPTGSLLNTILRRFSAGVKRFLSASRRSKGIIFGWDSIFDPMGRGCLSLTNSSPQ